MKINEIFCSIQGEGFHTGVPTVFIRTSGCNLRCHFCDTEYQSGKEMRISEIIAEAQGYAPRHAVITGGEPSLQADLPKLVEQLHQAGFYVQIETNGTRPLPPTIEWVTCSPKVIGQTVVRCPHELKVVYEGQDMQVYNDFQAQVYSLQPCDTGDARRNAELLRKTVDYVLQHPKWRLSLQTHKLIGVK